MNPPTYNPATHIAIRSADDAWSLVPYRAASRLFDLHALWQTYLNHHHPRTLAKTHDVAPTDWNELHIEIRETCRERKQPFPSNLLSPSIAQVKFNKDYHEPTPAVHLKYIDVYIHLFPLVANVLLHGPTTPDVDPTATPPLVADLSRFTAFVPTKPNHATLETLGVLQSVREFFAQEPEDLDDDSDATDASTPRAHPMCRPTNRRPTLVSPRSAGSAGSVGSGRSLRSANSAMTDDTDDDDLAYLDAPWRRSYERIPAGLPPHDVPHQPLIDAHQLAWAVARVLGHPNPASILQHLNQALVALVPGADQFAQDFANHETPDQHAGDIHGPLDKLALIALRHIAHIRGEIHNPDDGASDEASDASSDEDSEGSDGDSEGSSGSDASAESTLSNSYYARTTNHRSDDPRDDDIQRSRGTPREIIGRTITRAVDAAAADATAAAPHPAHQHLLHALEYHTLFVATPSVLAFAAASHHHLNTALALLGAPPLPLVAAAVDASSPPATAIDALD